MKKVDHQKSLKAIGLISGGLDSALAVKIVQGLGVEVHGMHFILPWLDRPADTVIKMARQLNVPLEVFFCREEFLEMIKKPKHGYGVAMNPCIDCHIYQLQKAKEFMITSDADFVITGEVLGQRPMSQNRQQLLNIEKESGLGGKLLRPLSAKLLAPTELESCGVIDREKLFDFSGRSRSGLQSLAKNLGITDYIPTGGGCLLTDKNFAKRLKDLFTYGYRGHHEIILLSVGRHFRLSNHHKVIVGRDENENSCLLEQAHPKDVVLQLKDFLGPLALLQGKEPSQQMIDQAAFLVKRYSKFRDRMADVCYWRKEDPLTSEIARPKDMLEQDVEMLKIA
ncbi:MAG TPA: tRNA 4-thiouridine(8) synthase ThiI [Candidatus Omnitrophota bacterium]|nr:tRNA 4-thiouridine(8) synthase ThiI [Candidatus Omnitrophota bacterium]HQL41804.1 tRNA 4-thiouridine(8) synthase ThiI [Candidatus Omnitrophota bacterium]